MTTALAERRQHLQPIAQIQRDTNLAVREAIESGDNILKDLAIACGLEAMRKAFTPEIVGVISGLAGTSLGFRHDKETTGQKYSPDVIRDCAIEALLRGVSLTGNQFNIIGGRCYITREGYVSLLQSYPGLTDLQVEVGLPEDNRQWGKQEMVFLTAAARCKVNGVPVIVECRKTPGFDGRLAVKAFSGEPDQAKGKAQKRVLKLLYERITGSAFSEPDAPDDAIQAADVIEVQAEPQIDWHGEMLKLESQRAVDCWEAIDKCKSKEKLIAILDHARKEDMTGKDRDSIARFAEHVGRSLQS